MKIVQFMASEGWGGAEGVFVELSNELAKHHQVVALLLRGTEYIARFSSAVEVVELRSHPTRHNPFLLYETYSRLRDIGPDILHSHAVKGTELFHAVNRFLHIPHVGTKHNVRKGHIFNRLAFATAVSEASRRTIHSTVPARVEVIFNGISPVNVPEGKKNDVFTLLAIGRLDRVKGFDVLIRQMRLADFDFRLLIVGEGPERMHLEKTIHGLGLQEKVHLLGFREDIPHLMKTAHGVVISSQTEGFSKVMVEGLFYAAVVISTPVGIAPDILPQRFLAGQEHLGEKIAELQRHYDRFAHDFKIVAEERRDAFLFPSIVAQYDRLYREMVEKTTATATS